LPKTSESMTRNIFQSVVTALLIAILASAFQTYVEVKMLRKDVNELRHDLDVLYGLTNDLAQKGK